MKLKPCPFCGSRLIDKGSGNSIFCLCCRLWGPDNDPYGHKWNSTPRRSEVLELIRLVETTERDLRLSKLYERFKSVVVFANKLRKEIGE